MGVSLIYQTGQVVPEKLVKMKPYDEFQEMDIFDPCDPYGQYEVKVVSKFTGYVIGHNNNPVVHQGDALFHVGITD